MSKLGRRLALNLLVLLVLLVLVTLNVGPLVWGVLTSIKNGPDLFTYPPKVWRFSVTFEHYELAWAGGFARAFFNSFGYALGSVVLGVVLAGLAGFGFDRFRFRFRAGLFLLIVASIPLAIGAAALLVPNFLYFTAIGFTNHWFTLPVVYTAYTLPMAIWIMKGAVEGIPRELDEAAYVDGASSFTVFRIVVMPLCKPAIAAVGLLLFISAWNEFIAGSVMVDAPALRPVQVAIYQFIGFFGREWGPLTAAATIAIAPIILIYLLLGRLLVSGLTRGAVKD